MGFNPWNKRTLFYTDGANWIYGTLPSQIPVCSCERLSHRICLHRSFGFSCWNKSIYKKKNVLLLGGNNEASAYIKRIYLSNPNFAATCERRNYWFFKMGIAKGSTLLVIWRKLAANTSRSTCLTWFDTLLSSTCGSAFLASSKLCVFAAFTKPLLLPTCSIKLARGENCCPMCCQG